MTGHDSGSEPSGSVGYGRPPTGSMFKPGQSGNPRGRPKRRSIKADLRDALSESTTGKADGPTKQQALVRRLVDDAVGGDTPSVKLLFSLSAALLRDESDDDAEQVTAEHQTLLDQFEKRNTLANKLAPNQGDSHD
jgi:hypothetical protein